MNPNDLAEHLTHFYNGGTEPCGSLVKAWKIVNQVSNDKQRADVLIITHTPSPIR